MVPASVIFLVGSLFSLQTRINAGFTPGDQPRQWARLITSSY